ncbi:hypothetical protein TNCT_521161, partial [Trichonephila clavata]
VVVAAVAFVQCVVARGYGPGGSSSGDLVDTEDWVVWVEVWVEDMED